MVVSLGWEADMGFREAGGMGTLGPQCRDGAPETL